MKRAILIGGAVGAIDGFLLLVFPPLAAVLILLILFAPPRPAVAAGALMGVGLGMLVLLLLESTRCAADSACTGPDLTGWLTAGAVCFLGGLLLAAAAGRRSRRAAS